jgi:hypothetical protein
MKKCNFVQSWGSYSIETIVSVGTTHEEVVRYCKKMKFKKEMIEHLEKSKEEIKKLQKKSKGLFCILSPGNLIWINEYTDDWDFYQVLIHELFHAVFGEMGQERGMEKEEEAMAYQQEFLFKEIRRKLYKIYGIKKKRSNKRAYKKR